MKQQFCKPLAWSPLAGGNINLGTGFKSEIIKSKLSEIGKIHDAHLEQIAVAWLLQLGTLPVVGSLDHSRIKNAAKAYEIFLSNEEWHEIYNTVK